MRNGLKALRALRDLRNVKSTAPAIIREDMMSITEMAIIIKSSLFQPSFIYAPLCPESPRTIDLAINSNTKSTNTIIPAKLMDSSANLLTSGSSNASNIEDAAIKE